MNRLTRTILVITVVFGFASSALAQQQHDGYGFVMGSYVESDSVLNLDDGKGVQLGGGWALSKLWNMEVFYQHTKTDGSPNLSDSTFGADLQLVMLREARFSPYLFAGIGSMNLNSSDMSTDRSSMRNAGAGFRARIFGDSRAAIRAEYRLRDYHAYGTDLDDNLISLGIQIPFGEARPTFVDSDGDGVADGMDQCPNTPPGRTVDANGCEADGDGDGVSDGDDRCPNTPTGTPVNSSGCEIDSDGDGDGVSDNIDECPNTVAGAVVDSRGCELDDDEDGVVNRLDKCPNTASGAQVDVAGCEIREEISLPGVNFESNSDLLVRGTDSVLNDAAATLEKNPEITVEVAGHTDSDGAADYNESLSARRAATVRDYLIGRGVSADRLTVRGYGESQPIADNATADGKATNRRVVLRITAR